MQSAWCFIQDVRDRESGNMKRWYSVKFTCEKGLQMDLLIFRHGTGLHVGDSERYGRMEKVASLDVRMRAAIEEVATHWTCLLIDLGCRVKNGSLHTFPRQYTATSGLEQTSNLYIQLHCITGYIGYLQYPALQFYVATEGFGPVNWSISTCIPDIRKVGFSAPLCKNAVAQAWIYSPHLVLSTFLTICLDEEVQRAPEQRLLTLSNLLEEAGNRQEMLI